MNGTQSSRKIPVAKQLVPQLPDMAEIEAEISKAQKDAETEMKSLGS